MAMKPKVIGHIISMFANKCKLTVWISFFAIFAETWMVTQAGTCWRRVGNNRRCQHVSGMDVTKADCCGSSGSALRGWTSQNHYTSDRLFYYRFMMDGAPECFPCHRFSRHHDRNNGRSESCDAVNCQGTDRGCRIKDGLARCVCMPDCSEHNERQRGPVCGNDGNSYKNYCTLLKYNCRKEKHTEVDYYGRCKFTCTGVHCPNGRHCVEDQNGMPHCIPCNEHELCPRVPTEIMCGADGNTYQSVCAFHKATCLNGRSIGLAYMGECDPTLTCGTVNCQPGKKCLLTPDTNRPQCVTCETDCESYLPSNPVCGTNGRSYPSWCDMHRESCRTGVVIDTQHYGPCHRDGEYRDFEVQHDDYYIAYDDE